MMAIRSSASYRVVAWSRDAISTGWLRPPKVELQVLCNALRDIRNCSLTSEAIYATAYERGSDRHGLWRVDRHGGALVQIVAAEYLLHNAASADGSRIVYTVPLHGVEGEAEMYVVAQDGTTPRRLIEQTVNRFSIPRWAAGSNIVFAHNSQRQVLHVDIAAARATATLDGEFPSPAPASNRLAYRIGHDIHILDREHDERLELAGFRHASPIGVMSWSADERMLLAADTGTALGYSVGHFLIDIASQRATRLEKTPVLTIEFDVFAGK